MANSALSFQSISGSLNSQYTSNKGEIYVYSIVGNGLNGIIQIPHNSNYNFERTDTFTISFAVMFNSLDVLTSTTIIGKYDGSIGRGWYIQKIVGKPRFVLISASGNSIILDATYYTFVANKLYHIAITNSGNSVASGVHIYVNGVEIAMTITSDTLTGTTVNTKPIELFHRDVTAGYSLDKITHVQVFNAALSNDQCGNLWGGLYFDTNPITHYSSCVLNWFAENMTFSSSNYSSNATIYTSGVPSTITITSTNIANGSKTSTNINNFDASNLLLDTRGMGDVDRLLNYQGADPQTFYSSITNRTYRTYKQKGGIDAHDVKRIIYFDHNTNKTSKIFTAGTGQLLSDDNHLQATIFESTSGYQMVAYEYLHNTEVRIKRVTTQHDLETLVQVAVIQVGATDQSTNPLPVSYPSWKQFSNGEIWMFFRHGRTQLSYTKSTDDGLTWSSLHVILNGDRNGAVGGVESTLNWTYSLMVQTSDDNLRFFLTHTGSASAGDASNLYFNSYIESTDMGITWKNVSGSFSKNINTSGIVTYTELLNNCKFEDHCSFRSAARSPNGTNYASGQDLTGANNYLWYSNGSAWTRKSITPAVLSVAAHTLFVTDSLVSIVLLETVSSKNLPSLYTSTDQGTTWTLVKRLSIDQSKNYSMITTNLPTIPDDKRQYFAGNEDGNMLISF